MAENPYLVLSAFDPLPRASETERDIPRPTGVSILAVLHIIGGIVLIGVQFLMFANRDAMEESLRTIGVSSISVVIGVMFLSVLAIASGVGMWLGTRWGWWLATFYYVHSIFGNAMALVTVASLADQLDDATHGPKYYFMKHGGRIIVHFLLLLYFFRPNVLEFFALGHLSKPKAIGIQVGLCIAIVAFTSAMSLLAS